MFSSFDPGKVDPGLVASWTEAQLMADPFGAVATMIDLPSVAGQLMPALTDAGLASVDEVLYFSAYVQAKARPATDSPAAARLVRNRSEYC